MKLLVELVTFFASCMTILASGIAVYLFVTKRNVISTAFKILLNYSYQTTLTELKEKLERLNEYNAEDSDGLLKITNILHEIHGQILGNPTLRVNMNNIIIKLDVVLNAKKKLSEPRKRALVSEIREQLKHLNAESIESFFGD